MTEWNEPDKAIEKIKSMVSAVLDFPIPGITFRDIMPIFQDPQAVTALINIMAAYVEESYPDVDVIIGMDARGFLIGPMIACNLGKPFVPIRKKGKLPGKCITADSTKEYGKDTLEMQSNALKPGQKAVIVDDLLATGGTVEASCKLVEQAKCSVLGCLCIIELDELNGKSKLSYPFYSFIHF